MVDFAIDHGTLVNKGVFDFGVRTDDLRGGMVVFGIDTVARLNGEEVDLGIAGVVIPTTIDALVTRAIITYARMNFGSPDDYDRLKAAYDEQKAQLQMATGYTDWGGSI